MSPRHSTAPKASVTSLFESWAADGDIPNSTDNTRNQNNIVFFLFTIFWIEDDFNYLLWNAKKLNTVVDETFFKKRSILFNLLQFPICSFLKFFEKLLCKRYFIVYFELIFRYFINFVPNINRIWFLMLHFHTILNTNKFRTWCIIVIFDIFIRLIGINLTNSQNTIK